MDKLFLILSLFLFGQIKSLIASECACATTNVHVRSAAGTTHHILGTLSTGSCVAFKGQVSPVGGYHWANVDYHGQVKISTIPLFPGHDINVLLGFFNLTIFKLCQLRGSSQKNILYIFC